eukprot:scaffold3830_cov108-Isochrysis_galbana.AAC.1
MHSLPASGDPPIPLRLLGACRSSASSVPRLVASRAACTSTPPSGTCWSPRPSRWRAPPPTRSGRTFAMLRTRSTRPSTQGRRSGPQSPRPEAPAVSPPGVSNRPLPRA